MRQLAFKRVGSCHFPWFAMNRDGLRPLRPSIGKETHLGHDTGKYRKHARAQAWNMNAAHFRRTPSRNLAKQPHSRTHFTPFAGMLCKACKFSAQGHDKSMFCVSWKPADNVALEG